MSKQDLDLVQKLRFRRILFSQGYWSPLEVDLSHFDLDNGKGVTAIKRASLTDLDVLGIKYDPLFTPNRVVGDCKTGRNVSDANRLFWLRGVMSYFGADQGYFIRPILASHIRGMAPKVGIRLLSDTDLADLEKTLGADKYAIPVGDTGIYGAMDDLWGADISRGSKPSEDQLRVKAVYSFLSYNYWYIDSRRNLASLLDLFGGIADLLSSSRPRDTLLVFVAIERFAHCLLEAAAFLQSQALGEVARYARIYVHGGVLEARDKERFFELLRQLTGGQEQADPSWLRDITELLSRMMRNPAGAHDVLRHITAMYLCCVHLNRAELPPLNGEKTNTAAVVLAKDIAKCFVRAAGLQDSFLDSIKNA